MDINRCPDHCIQWNNFEQHHENFICYFVVYSKFIKYFRYQGGFFFTFKKLNKWPLQSTKYNWFSIKKVFHFLRRIFNSFWSKCFLRRKYINVFVKQLIICSAQNLKSLPTSVVQYKMVLPWIFISDIFHNIFLK